MFELFLFPFPRARTAPPPLLLAPPVEGRPLGRPVGVAAAAVERATPFFGGIACGVVLQVQVRRNTAGAISQKPTTRKKRFELRWFLLVGPLLCFRSRVECRTKTRKIAPVAPRRNTECAHGAWIFLLRNAGHSDAVGQKIATIELQVREKIWGWCNASCRNGSPSLPLKYLEGPGLTRVSAFSAVVGLGLASI